MKTRRLIFVLVVIVLGAPLLLLLKPGPPTPPITSGFLGFTNHPTGQAALFAITNYPEGAIFPNVIDMAQLENSEWKSVPKLLQGWPPWQCSIGGQPEVVYTLPVPTTNVPVRVVLQIRTEPTGWRALAQRTMVKMGRSPRQWHVRLPAQYFTNETVVGGAMPQSGTR